MRLHSGWLNLKTLFWRDPNFILITVFILKFMINMQILISFAIFFLCYVSLPNKIYKNVYLELSCSLQNFQKLYYVRYAGEFY